jgi:hypothetical protein
MPKGKPHKARKPRAMTTGVDLHNATLEAGKMNRQQRRAYKSSKQERYRGLSKPTDNGAMNSSRKGKAGY